MYPDQLHEALSRHSDVYRFLTAPRWHAVPSLDVRNLSLRHTIQHCTMSPTMLFRLLLLSSRSFQLHSKSCTIVDVTPSPVHPCRRPLRSLKKNRSVVGRNSRGSYTLNESTGVRERDSGDLGILDISNSHVRGVNDGFIATKTNLARAIGPSANSGCVLEEGPKTCKPLWACGYFLWVNTVTEYAP